MQIRRFEAKTMTVALRMVKDELGPEAVILSARSLKKGSGVFGTAKNVGVEVTAATDTYYPSVKNAYPQAGNAYSKADKGFPAVSEDYSRVGKASSSYANEAASPKPHSRPPEVERKKKKGMLQSFQGGLRGLTGRRRVNVGEDREAAGIEKKWTQLLQHFVSQEIMHETACQFIENFKETADPDDIFKGKNAAKYLTACIEDMGVVDGRAIAPGKTPKVLALIGPCGVGKTTTIAKLAVQQTMDHKKDVVLINLDNYRIGADAQLSSYARIIGVPLEAAGSPAEFKAAVKKHSKKDLILVDTPGISHNNSGQIKRLSEFLGALKSFEAHLVLDAAAKEKILLDTIKRFQDLPLHRLIFTKIDESDTYGSLLNLSLKSKMPLSFLSTGQQVPEDLGFVTADKLADLILNTDGFSFPEESEDSHPGNAGSRAGRVGTVNAAYLVANKNSDVYHDPSCKWARKIKPENIIEFRSAAEAESKRFIPCRNCNTERIEKRSNIPQTRDRVRISSYR